LKLAETGHLVFSTLHTRDAADTIYRFVSLFPPTIQTNARDRLAAGLLGIQSQFLLKTADGQNRVGLYELLINSNAVRNDIRKNNGQQIDSIIETSRQRGMISHSEYAKRLIAEGKITKEQVDWLFS
jgi:twitching motility protein PilT